MLKFKGPTEKAQGWNCKEYERLGLIGVPLQSFKGSGTKLKKTIILLFIIFFPKIKEKDAHFSALITPSPLHQSAQNFLSLALWMVEIYSSTSWVKISLTHEP
jgi:hypothetical protein